MDYRLLSVFALVLWGAWGFLAKIISSSVSPQSLAFWSTLATVVPVAVFALTDSTGKWTRPHPMALGAGLAYGLALVFFFVALRRGPASVVVPLSGMYILIPAVLGFIFLKEYVTVSHIIGLVCAALAVFFLTR
ncbi:MAG: DMT family transporter [candidate division WOR-3 bacterium]|nr:DMT family transporter [candidate division WOR-3 bacterium]